MRIKETRGRYAETGWDKQAKLRASKGESLRCRYIASFDTFRVRLRDTALYPPSRVVDGLGRRGRAWRYGAEEMGE